ncbi:late blight resistance homolog R1A-10 [Olea europaea subsp. europaea]|uniref:Late blight resistance homolog R1A-10 n=1 Tax=Olea europaea subsp. europaea TaxID=158383 RepID=A0A8S0R9U8_OLEEU|nr:late blight resistance homolog R1A-10 [Olea europaea subsp. europaea]
MAYAALLSLTQRLEQILHPDYQRPILLHKTDSQILRSLDENLRFLLSFLEEDSGEKNRKAFECLEGRIRDAVYEAEDIVESHLSNQIPLGSGIQMDQTEPQMLSQIVPELEQEYEGLQKIIDELNLISEEMVKRKGMNHIEDLHPRKTLPAESSKSGSSIKSGMVGFDDELIQIKDRLTGSSTKLEIISIVGMGGIGKTTLAKNIYDDSLIVYRFDTRAWITVSQYYRVQEMLTGVLVSRRNLSQESYEKDTEKLGEQLYKSLKGNRYLIVMDDVWDTKAWDEVQRFFPDDNNGSRIILTTRKSHVAVYANSSSPICHLSLLSPIQSWDLLRHLVFGEQRCPPEFEEIGMAIANNCRGLPLSVSVIGGLLYRSKGTVDYWMHVKQNINSAVTGPEDKIMEILSLSYNDLPHHLRSCFLYMGAYPEDHQIQIPQLMKLWIAEGFVKPVGSKSMEAVAETYLEDLIDRNMVLVLERNFTGKIKACGLHDLMRDLCVRKSREKKFLQVICRHVEFSPECIYNQRRISIQSDIYDCLSENYVSRVRSLLYFKTQSNTRDGNIFISFPLLKVLNVFDELLPEFPVELAELVNLRYFAIFTQVAKLPVSIAKLFNLQTIIIRSFDTVNLPLEILMIPQLRHILIEKCFLPCSAQIRKNFVLSENLQTLEILRNFRFTKEVLQKMSSLKKLTVDFYCDEDTPFSSCFDSIIHLYELEDLKCLFHYQNDPLPENFALASRLKNLTLSHCGLSWKNMAVLGLLLNLELLKLKNISFDGKVWEPSEGEFPKLKFLLLLTTNLEHWRANKTHFPNLQRLSLGDCPKLVEIPSGIGEFPTLQEIIYFRCPAAVTSLELIQKEQEDLGCYLRIIHDSRKEEMYELTGGKDEDDEEDERKDEEED